MNDQAFQIATDPVDKMHCHKCKTALNVAGIASFADIICPQCRTRLIVPAQLGAFRLLELLGQGGMGAVFKGEDTELDRPVAVKVLLRSVGQQPEFLETFHREAKAAAALSHPNIVQIYQFGRAKGQPYIVMELLTGGRLDQMIAAGRSLDPAMVIKIGLDVAEGLKAAADIGLVHGDIKPENILLDANGAAKIVDFGLAAFMDREGRREGVWGTPYYIAPEKLREAPGDHRSDIYSLGGTLFHALTLKPPFEGATAADVVKARLLKPAPRVREHRRDIHEEIERVVERMLETEPSRRYPTYVSLIADLRAVAADIGPPKTLPRTGTKRKIVVAGRSRKVAGSPGSVSSYAAKRPRKKKSSGAFWGWLFFLAVLASGAAGGWWYWRDYQAQRAEQQRRATLRRLAGEAAALVEEFTGWSDKIDALLKETHPLLHAATNRLAQAGLELRELGIEEGLDRVAPELNATPQRFLSALEEAENAGARMRERFDEANAQSDDLRRSVDPAAASELLEGIRGIAEAAAMEKNTALERIETARNEHAALDGLEEVLARRKELAAEAERRRIEEEARQRELEFQRREEEERRRQLAELARAEGERLATVRREVVPLIRRNDFDGAIRAARRAAADIETEEVRESAERWTDRLELLEEMKSVIVAQLSAAPFPWGWRGQLDVTGADAEFVRLATRAIPWSEVPPDQMLRFINRYADAVELNRDIRARFNLAAAAYFYENQVMHQARGFAERAVINNAAMRAEIKRLMPELEIP